MQVQGLVQVQKLVQIQVQGLVQGLVQVQVLVQYLQQWLSAIMPEPSVLHCLAEVVGEGLVLQAGGANLVEALPVDEQEEDVLDPGLEVERLLPHCLGHQLGSRQEGDDASGGRVEPYLHLGSAHLVPCPLSPPPPRPPGRREPGRPS